MRFNKKYKQGLFLLFLLFLITTSISFITFNPESNILNENTVSLSAPEDSYEPNNIYTNAFDLTTYYSMWLSSIYGEGAQHDDDWYQIDVAPEFGYLIIECSFSNISGNIDMDLYDSSDPFNPVATSWTENDYEYIYYNLPWNGIYYIKIHGLNNTNNYDLRWMGDDVYEENDDYWSATWVDPNYYFGLNIIKGDDDWFKTYLNAGDTINVSIYFDDGIGNLQLELYDPYNSSNARVGSYTDWNDESILFIADVSGDWRIHIYHEFADTEVNYDLDIWVYPGDDMMEENDDYWSAQWVNARYYPDLRIKEYDEDWFRTYLTPDTTIEIRIYFDNYQGNLQLELYDPNDPNISRDGSYNDWNDENIFFTADMSGDWRFRVYRVSGDYNMVVHYNMEVWINGTMEGDDPYEPNNSPDRAYDLRDYEGKWLSKIHGLAVQGDEDWYLIDVTPGFQHLIINLTFDPYQGHINIELYRAFDRHSIDWNPVYSNYSMIGENRAVINYHYIDPGIYMIQVRGDFTGVEYNMWWDDERTDHRSDDNYEENDDYASAYDLSSHEGQDLWSISGLAILNDSDCYKIQVRSGFEHLFVSVKYDYQEGPIGLEIRDARYSLVKDNFTMKDNDYISYDLPSNGTYYIRIFGDYEKSNIYNLWWDTKEPSTEEMIPGYDIFILLGALFGVVVLFTLKWKRSKNHL